MISLRAAALVLLTVFLLGGPMLAQNPNQPQQGIPNFQGKPGEKPKKLDLVGRLTAAQAPLIKVKPEKANEEWVIRVESKPDEISVKGEAERGWVKPGMFVTFDATLDKKGMGQEPIGEVSVFAPGPTIQLGVTEAAAAGFSAEGEESAAPAESAKYNVVGRLSGVSKDGKWSVTAGRAKVTVEVAEDAKISVDLPDPRLIRIGDTVKGSVTYFNQGAGILKGLIEIEAAEKFPAPEDPRARRTRREPAAKPGEAKSIFDMQQ
ncbi:hypothetical protein GC197_11100 [bacterium]|nr:hypothetical protein [bacterium]